MLHSRPKFQAAFVVLLLPLALCAQQPSGEAPHHSGDAYSVYLPLATGNWWKYVHGLPGSRPRETVIDSSYDSSNRLWYLFDHFRGIDSAALRYEAGGKLYLCARGVEQLYLDFAATPGTKWKFAHPILPDVSWEISLVSSTDSVTTPLGAFTRVHRFDFHGINMADNDWSESYAAGIGAITRTLYGFGVMSDTLTDYNFHNTPTGSGDPVLPAPSAIVHSAFPMPGSGLITIPIEITREAMHCVLTLYDEIGRMSYHMFDGLLRYGRNQVTLHTAGIPAGTYFLHLETGDGRVVRRVQIVR